MFGRGTTIVVFPVPHSGDSDSAARDLFVRHYLPLVERIADAIHAKFHSQLNVESLRAAGILGLLEAYEQYVPNRQISFRGFAEHRIRGAILDSIDNLDGLAQRKQKLSRQIERAILSAEKRLRCTPSEDEIAEELKMSRETYRNCIQRLQSITLLAFEPHESDKVGLFELIGSRTELAKLLANCIDHMPDQERTTLTLCYQESFTFVEIATILDVNETRVAELHTQAILRLRAKVAKRRTSKGRSTKDSNPLSS